MVFFRQKLACVVEIDMTQVLAPVSSQLSVLRSVKMSLFLEKSIATRGAIATHETGVLDEARRLGVKGNVGHAILEDLLASLLFKPYHVAHDTFQMSVNELVQMSMMGGQFCKLNIIVCANKNL